MISIVGKNVGETVMLMAADSGEPFWRAMWYFPSILKVHVHFVQQPHH